jgi:hypothetical protein
MLVEEREGYLGAELELSSGDEANRQERMPAQLEKVVIDAEALHAKGVAPDAEQLILEGRQ